MIRMVVEAGARHDVPVTVCGQMSSDPKLIPLLIGLGLRQLSATPQAIPGLKDVMRRWTVAEAEAVAEHALTLEMARDIETYLRGEYHRVCPEVVTP